MNTPPSPHLFIGGKGWWGGMSRRHPNAQDVPDRFVGESETLRWGRSNPSLGKTRTPVREHRPSQQGTTPVPPAHIVSAVWGNGTANFIFVSAIFGNVSATFRSSPPRKRRQPPSRCRALPPNGTTHQANPSSHRWELNGNLDGNLDFARDGL